MKIIAVPVTDLTQVQGGFYFELNAERNYMTAGGPEEALSEAVATQIVDQLEERYPVKWLPETIYLLPHRLRTWSKSYGWGQDYNGETFFNSHIVIGTQANSLEAYHTVIHEIGHLIFHHLVSPEKWEEWLKLRGIVQEYYSWKDKPTEIFAEDFFYLFGGAVAKEGRFAVYDGTPVPPGPDTKEWFLSLLGDKTPDEREVGDQVSNKYLELDLRQPSGISAYILDQFLKGTPMAGLGAYFITAEKRYSVNAQYLCAHAVHESDFGRSRIAQDKHNLFGFGAYDSNPYDNAYTYASFEDCIYRVAKYIADNYLSPSGKYYNGPTLKGMNVKYATDQLWANNIANWMSKIEEVAGLASFKDTEGHWAEADIEKAKELGLMSGYPDGNFKPDQPVTRAEMAAVLVRIAK